MRIPPPDAPPAAGRSGSIVSSRRIAVLTEHFGYAPHALSGISMV